jgi:hypothetical protein
MCEDYLNFEDVASDEILKILETLTGCEFHKDLKQGKLFISHSLAENCQSAIKKLDNLQRYSVTSSHILSDCIDLTFVRNPERLI